MTYVIVVTDIERQDEFVVNSENNKIFRTESLVHAQSYAKELQQIFPDADYLIMQLTMLE